MQDHNGMNINNDNRQIEGGPSTGPSGASGANTTDFQSTTNVTGAGSDASQQGAQQDINNMLQQGIQGAKNIQEQLTNTASVSGTGTKGSPTAGDNTGEASQNNTSPEEKIEKASNTLENINKIKEAIATLPLDPTQLVYYNTCVSPLLSTLGTLGTLSDDLSTSVSILTASPIVCAKHHKLKDTLHLIYDVNEKCEDIFKELESRIDILLELGICWDIGNNSCINNHKK